MLYFRRELPCFSSEERVYLIPEHIKEVLREEAPAHILMSHVYTEAAHILVSGHIHTEAAHILVSGHIHTEAAQILVPGYIHTEAPVMQAASGV